MKTKEIIDNSKKIVLKIGSHVLADEGGLLDADVIKGIAEQVASLISSGKQIVIVSSGAEISGAGVMNLHLRRGDINYKQALCSIGQVELMNNYRRHFKEYGINVGQLLLTRDNFESENSALHIRNTLFTLLDEGVVPIINENDSVSVDELTIGDNDALAALTANLWNADLLVLMSNIDGLYDKPPCGDDSARIIDEVAVCDIDRLTDEIDTRGKSEFGTGGMISKLAAAKTVGAYGTPMLLVNGKTSGVLLSAAEGTATGTLFLP